MHCRESVIQVSAQLAGSTVCLRRNFVLEEKDPSRKVDITPVGSALVQGCDITLVQGWPVEILEVRTEPTPMDPWAYEGWLLSERDSHYTCVCPGGTTKVGIKVRLVLLRKV